MSCHDGQPVQQVQATIETALDFGLDPREACETIAEVWQSQLAEADAPHVLDELTSALAARILEHERGAPGRRSERPRR